jgi:hypothetical protein
MILTKKCFAVVMSGHNLPISPSEITKEQRELCFLQYDFFH